MASPLPTTSSPLSLQAFGRNSLTRRRLGRIARPIRTTRILASARISGDLRDLGLVVEAVATDRPSAVLVDGISIPEGIAPGGAVWSWSEDTGGTLWLQLAAGPHAVAVDWR